MKILVIIPAHNEAKYLGFCLQSLKEQTFKDVKVVVVDDGSTDQTAEIAEKFVKENAGFELVKLPQSEHQPGAKVVRTFNEGLKTQTLQDFDILCKFDADIIFPPTYLQRIEKEFSENPRAGMVSGLVRIKKSVFENQLAFDFKDEKRQWKFEDISSKNHVRGPIKSYRKECFKEINGLRPVLGWDNIDVMLAQKSGWEVITLKDVWVKHLRPTAFKYKNQKAEKLGEYFYNIGLSFPLAVISSAKSSLKNKSILEFFITMKSFLNQEKQRSLTAEEIKYIRKLRWNAMFKKF